jgi:predicted acyl esterase
MADVVLEQDVRVPMRDGVRLSVDVNRPQGSGPFPAILSLCPYGKESQRFPPGHFSFVESGNTPYYVQHGYAHILADSRGSVPSEGRWELSSRAEQEDGYDLVEWIAGQPWCTGKIAMVGGSYYGQIQFLVAATQPPHLTTILPFNGWTDLYRDFIYHGGLFRRFFPGWFGGVMERSQAGSSEPIPPGWQPAQDLLTEVLVKHKFDDPFYHERSLFRRFDRIKIPVYHLVSTASYNHYRGQLISFNEIKTRQKLMLLAGNLRRALYSPALSTEIVRWLDYC